MKLIIGTEMTITEKIKFAAPQRKGSPRTDTGYVHTSCKDRMRMLWEGSDTNVEIYHLYVTLTTEYQGRDTASVLSVLPHAAEWQRCVSPRPRMGYFDARPTAVCTANSF